MAGAVADSQAGAEGDGPEAWAWDRSPKGRERGPEGRSSAGRLAVGVQRTRTPLGRSGGIRRRAEGWAAPAAGAPPARYATQGAEDREPAGTQASAGGAPQTS